MSNKYHLTPNLDNMLIQNICKIIPRKIIIESCVILHESQNRFKLKVKPF